MLACMPHLANAVAWPGSCWSFDCDTDVTSYSYRCPVDMSCSSISSGSGVVVIRSGNGDWGEPEATDGTHLLGLQRGGKFIEQTVDSPAEATSGRPFTLGVSFSFRRRMHSQQNDPALTVTVNGQSIFEKPNVGRIQGWTSMSVDTEGTTTPFTVRFENTQTHSAQRRRDGVH